MFENWAQAAWETDPYGFVVADSPSWRAYTGQTPEEWLGYGWLNAIHPSDRAYAERQWREAVVARRPVNAEFRLRVPTGGWRWTNVCAAPVLDAERNIEKWVGMNIDIHARKTAETALQESEERLHVALASAKLGTFVWHVAEDRTEEDAQARVHFGLPPDGTVSLEEALATTFHPDDGPRYAAAVARAIDPAGPGSLHEEYRIRHPDGQERWMSTSAITAFADTPRVAVRLTGVLADITDRKQAEAALKASEERQAFLLELSDALRPLRNAREVRAQACRLLGEHLSASRAYYVEYHPEQGYGIVADDYLVPGLPSLAGRYPFEAFRSTYQRIGDGCTWIVSDVSADRELPEHERDFYAAQDVIAWINVPLAKAGVLEAALCVVQTETRGWTTSEIVLVEETAERLWAAIQRGRSEAELSESEERFRQFATAASTALWIRNAETLDMEYVSRAIEPIYGVPPDTFLTGVEVWASAIVPEDRASALAHLERARQGEAAIHEFRIQRLSDGAFRWIRNTDFPLYDAVGQVQRVGGIAEDITEAKRSDVRLEVLINELQHRARNLLGVVTAIADRTVKQGGSVEAFEIRLQALSRAQGLLSQGDSDTVAVGALVRAELAAHANEASGRVSITGPETYLTARQVQNFALALHELTTNAVKYGALKGATGQLAISWGVVLDGRERRRLALNWIESDVTIVPDTVARRGYGTELIQEALAYALQATVNYDLGPDGVRCRIEMPIA